MTTLREVRGAALSVSTEQEAIDFIDWCRYSMDLGLLAEAVSDSLAATTEGTDLAEAPEPSYEPGSPYVLRLTDELRSRGVTLAEPAEGPTDD